MMKPCRHRISTRVSSASSTTHLDPVRLRVCGDIVDEEARTKHYRKLKVVEEQVHRAVDPPAEQHEEWHPEERELDAEVDGARLRELLRDHRLLPQDVVHERAREEDDRDHTVGGERDDREQDEAEPPAGPRCQPEGTKRARETTYSSTMLPASRTGSIASTSCVRNQYQVT